MNTTYATRTNARPHAKARLTARGKTLITLCLVWSGLASIATLGITLGLSLRWVAAVSAALILAGVIVALLGSLFTPHEPRRAP